MPSSFQLQVLLFLKENTVLGSSFPFPLPSHAHLPSTRPLCPPSALLLPTDVQTGPPKQSPHSTCIAAPQHLRRRPMPYSTVSTPWRLPPTCPRRNTDPRRAGSAWPGGCKLRAASQSGRFWSAKQPSLLHCCCKGPSPGGIALAWCLCCWRGAGAAAQGTYKEPLRALARSDLKITSW